MSNISFSFLTILLGPMFSGKTTELNLRLIKYIYAKKKVIKIRPLKDQPINNDRPPNGSHNPSFISLPSEIKEIFTDNISDIINLISDYDIIGIDEIHFYKDSYDSIIHIVENMKKGVIISGIDGDKNKQPIGDILKLIPYANEVIKLNAVCFICGHNAPFSKAVKEFEGNILVGGVDTYQAVCRTHY